MSVGSIQCRLLTLVSSRHAMCSPNTKECSAPATPFVWAFTLGRYTLFGTAVSSNKWAVASTGSLPPRRSPAPTGLRRDPDTTRRHLPDLGACTSRPHDPGPTCGGCGAAQPRANPQARWHSATRILVLRSVLQLRHRRHLDRPGSREECIRRRRRSRTASSTETRSGSTSPSKPCELTVNGRGNRPTRLYPGLRRSTAWKR